MRIFYVVLGSLLCAASISGIAYYLSTGETPTVRGVPSSLAHYCFIATLGVCFGVALCWWSRELGQEGQEETDSKTADEPSITDKPNERMESANEVEAEGGKKEAEEKGQSPE